MRVKLTYSTEPTGTATAGARRPLQPLKRPVSGLLLDTCDVLYDATVWRRWLLQLLGRLGLHTNYHTFFRVWDHEFLADVHRGRREFRDALKAFLLSVGLSRAQIDEVEAACQARRRECEATARPLPGVKATLAKLRGAGVVLGAVGDSEHPAAALAERLERLGLDGLFTVVVSSIDLERTKPEPVCYLTALDAMKLRADEVAFVGHNSEELAGAAQVGMRTIAFNYDKNAEADVFLARFSDLLEVIVARPPYAEAV